MTGDEGGRPERASAEYEIINERGLHARAASKLVQLAGRYPCDVELSSPEAEGVNAKSVMGVLLLCGAKGTRVRVRARVRKKCSFVLLDNTLKLRIRFIKQS